jgi:hypothetical protein
MGKRDQCGRLVSGSGSSAVTTGCAGSRRLPPLRRRRVCLQPTRELFIDSIAGTLT